MTATPLGPGRVLAGGYTLFVVAAGGRCAVELASAVTFARLLSAVAAAVYATGLMLALAAERGRLRRAAVKCAALELGGVVVVGVLSLVLSPLNDTVWSHFGAGYLFVPLLLPAGMLVWLSWDDVAASRQQRHWTREAQRPEPSSPG